MKIWKKTNGTWYGYGNGYTVVIYELKLSETTATHVYANGNRLEVKGHPDIPTAKRWAERTYLKKGKK